MKILSITREYGDYRAIPSNPLAIETRNGEAKAITKPEPNCKVRVG